MNERIEDLTDLGRLLRDCRKSQGFTQEQAASLAGVSTRLWSECEQGTRTQVGFETLLRMIHIVGADLQFVRRMPDHMPAPPPS